MEAQFIRPHCDYILLFKLDIFESLDIHFAKM